MKILSVNAGSTTLKFQLYEMPEENVLISGNFERIGEDNSIYSYRFRDEKVVKEAELKNHTDAALLLIKELTDNQIVTSLEDIQGIGHRIVHGGSKYDHSVVIDDQVLKDLKDLIPLAPLHNPAHIAGIEAFKRAIPRAVNVAVFDTAFHQTLDPVHYLYPVPYEWYQEYGVRKYGFHGTSHQYIMNRMQTILNKEKVNMISCHLGGGGSVSAICNSKCIDTSMGFTPHAGIMMGTRSGDMDVSILPYVASKTGLSLEEMMNILNKKSGFLAISGISSDARDISKGVLEGNERCILAEAMYVKSVVSYIARYYIELDGNVDAICFTAGIGERSNRLREKIVKKLKPFGVILDEKANMIVGCENKISGTGSSIPVYVIPTNEELTIARDTYQFIR